MKLDSQIPRLASDDPLASSPHALPPQVSMPLRKSEVVYCAVSQATLNEIAVFDSVRRE